MNRKTINCFSKVRASPKVSSHFFQFPISSILFLFSLKNPMPLAAIRKIDSPRQEATIGLLKKIHTPLKPERY